jgi:hypothetical protein
MNETENNIQKPKLCRLAILSLLAILGWLIVIISSYLSEYSESITPPGWIYFLIYPATLIISIVAGILAICKIYKNYGKQIGIFSTIAGMLICIYFLYILAPRAIAPKFMIRRIYCMDNLKDLSMALNNYSKENGGKYPTPDKWCDLIKKNIRDKDFICPSSKAKKCSYAINPNCEPNSPQDMVLLFETKDGWNQFGGPEMLIPVHKRKSCNVLFNNGHVEFIKPDGIGKLKWKAE